MKGRWKIVLPALMGAVSTALMAWDIHNKHVTASMGMAWDTGSPVWPYQTAELLLIALNAPAFLPSNPISNLLGLPAISPVRYAITFCAILVLWWMVGQYLDGRPSTNKRKAPTWTLLLGLLGVGLLAVGFAGCLSAFQWWTLLGRVVGLEDLMLLREIGPSIWCFGVGLLVLRAVIRRVREPSPSPGLSQESF